MGKTMQNVNNVVMISCYFTEIAPSFMIMFVLWKSYIEKRDKLLDSSRSDKESLMPYSKAANASEEDGRLANAHTGTSILRAQDSSLVHPNEHSRTYIESLLDTVLSMSSDENDNSTHEIKCPYTYY